MTIHKSKGLEFPVVIFPFAEEDYSRSPKDKLWINAEAEDFGLFKVLIDNSKAVEGFGEQAKLVYDQKSQEELLDNINVLYVALTRAEEQLYIISQNLKPRKDGEYPSNMASFFIKYLVNEYVFDEDKLEYEFGNPTKLSTDIKHVDTSKAIPLVKEIFNPKNIKIAQKEALMWDDELLEGRENKDKREYGNLIHKILESVKTKNDIDLAITKAIEDGLITFKQSNFVYKTIQKIINHPELSFCFAEGNEVLIERAIILKERKILRPDRMVLTQNKEVFLFDYKTREHKPSHIKQLEEYQFAMESIGYKVVKKALIYIGTTINVVNL
jgi:ATP-dependent exoDNAse (exonuclease V) beta subunit